MKRYKKYMDDIKAPGALHQRLVELKEPGKRPIPWKKYGSIAAALVLVAGLGAWGVSRLSGGIDGGLVVYSRAETVSNPDIALVEPGEVDESAEKTLGGYDVATGSGSEAVVAHYILPYIEYGDTHETVKADWDIPQGAVRRDLTQDEIMALMGGEDVVSTHLDWGGYELSGWAAWYWDGSFWGAYINGLEREYGTDFFEFAVTDGRLPPSCVVYTGSVTQEVRGLTVTADKYDWELGGESLNIPERRVSFIKGDYGYRFVAASADVEQGELLVSRLVCRVADKGLGLDAMDTHAAMRSGTCPVCGGDIEAGTKHFHPLAGADEKGALENGVCPTCGKAADHTHPYDPNEAADPSHNAPDGSAAPVESQEVCGYPTKEHFDSLLGQTAEMDKPPVLKVTCGGGSLESSSGNYSWTRLNKDGTYSSAVACGAHPLEFRNAPSLTTTADTAELSLAGSPSLVEAVCWPDSQWGDTQAAGQELSMARNSVTLDHVLELKQGGWIYSVTARWASGSAQYVFYIIRN